MTPLASRPGRLAVLLAVGLLGPLLWWALPGSGPLLAVTGPAPPPLYLRSMGAGNILDATAPTAPSPQFKDAPAINRTTFKPVATWAAPPATSPVSLTMVSDLHVWLGLVNSDDQGTNFDLRAELIRNGVVIASGETKNVKGVTRNPSRAKEVTVAFGLISDPLFASGDVLALALSAKVADQGGHGSAVGLRVYYDAASRPARFGALLGPAETPPAADAGADVNALTHVPATLDGSGSHDADGDLLTFQWSLVSAPAGSAAALATATHPKPTFTPDLPGDYVFELIVNDGQGDSAPDRVTLRAFAGNAPPNARPGLDRTARVGTLVRLDGSASFDPDQAPLNFDWSFDSVPAGSALTGASIAGAQTATPQFTPDVAGTYVLRLHVNDGALGDEGTVQVVARLPNVGPHADAGADRTVHSGASVGLDGSASLDPDAAPSPISYAWALVSRPADSALTDAGIAGATTATPSFTPDALGQYLFRLRVSDSAAIDEDHVLVHVVANRPPVAVDDAATTNRNTAVVIPVLGNDTDPDGDALAVTSFTQGASGTVSFLNDVATYTPSAGFGGEDSFGYTIGDGHGGNASATVRVKVNKPPVVTAGAVNTTITLPAAAALTGSATDDGLPGPPATFTTLWTKADGPGTVTFGDATVIETTASFSEPGTYVLRLTGSDGALSAFAEVTITVSAAPGGGGLPPDPATVASALSRTSITPFGTGIEFLYTGPDPIQTGVAAGAIDVRRAAVIRGQVLDRAEAPLGGVAISILGHPEFGQTLSRADGMFDLAVNGGGSLTVKYEKTGFLPAQRLVQVPWQDYVFAPDVVLIPPDPVATAINLSLATPFQVARGSVVTDADGSRRGTLLFPQGTVASFRMPDGTMQPAPATLTVRLTEFTVGPTGPRAMPAQLPPTSGYTYALELSADEQASAGAVRVEFNQPVIFYVENFVGFPVGEIAPVGVYERRRGSWVAEPNGRTVKLVGITGGMADLDTDGDGFADSEATLTALGITTAERQTLAGLYVVGQELWRTPITHFSDPYDINWAHSTPPGSGPPNGDKPRNELKNKKDDPCLQQGSIIECQNQILGESLPVVGIPFTLNYRSDRVPGRRTAYQLHVPLVGATVPNGLKRVDVAIAVAGQLHAQAFPAVANTAFDFEWDGRDGYGRAILGFQVARIRVGFVYPALYQRSTTTSLKAWAATPGVAFTSSFLRAEITLFRDFEVGLGTLDVQELGVGGWTLSPHHTYDPVGKVIYLGTGERRSDADTLAPVIATVAGNGSNGSPADGTPATTQRLSPLAVAAAPDGAVFIYNQDNLSIYRLVPETGIITRFAGTGTFVAAPVDGVPARDAMIGNLLGGQMAVGPDGSLYVAGLNRVRRIRPDGSLIETIAGTGVAGFSGDGGPATAAQLSRPVGLAVTPDNTVYVMDVNNDRLRRIDPDGLIRTVAGTGQRANPILGPALQSPIWTSTSAGIALAPDGGVYLALHSARLYHVARDGILRDLGGGGSLPDGSLAIDDDDYDGSFTAGVYPATTPDGQLLFSTPARRWIRAIDQTGRVRTLAGTGFFVPSGFSGDGGPATQATFNFATSIAVAPDGSVYAVDDGNLRVRRIRTRFTGFAGPVDHAFASEDGRVVYQFDSSGRHLSTRHALTGATLWSFGYDTAGRLVTLTDGDSNVTTVERDGAGAPTAIVGPFGQRTVVTVDAAGYLASIANPAAETYQLGYTPSGLLTSMRTPKSQLYTFTYDPASGRLLTDADPAGGSQTLAQIDLPAGATVGDGHEVTRTTGLGRVSRYRVEGLRGGDRREVNTASDGTTATALHTKNGTMSLTMSSGMTATMTAGPDPRFGMLAPVPSQVQVRTPAGRTRTTAETRSDIVQFTETFSVNGRTSTSVYDAAAQQFTDTSAALRVGNTTIDTLGRPVAIQFGGLAPSAIIYDARGRLVSATTGTGTEARTWAFTYSAPSYVETITDPLARVTRFTYDTAGRILTQTRPDLRVITYTYDANGNLASLSPPGRPSHTFAYSAVDLEMEYNPPDVAGVVPDDTDTAYNVDRQVTSVTRADGRVVTPTYDAAGRLASLDFSRGSMDLTYSATTGLVTAATAPDGVNHAFTYDGQLLTRHTLSGPVPGTVARTYDNDFRVASQSVNGANTVSFTYDADSLLTQAGALALARSPQHGLLTGTTLGVVTDVLTYSSHAEMVDHRAQVSGADVYRAEFTRDALGRITRKVETILGAEDGYDYTYDLAGRLTEVTKNAVTVIAYTYDDNGNRESYAGPLGDVAAIDTVYDAQDRLTQYGAMTTFTYDRHGDLATKVIGGATTTYTYDELGNLTRVALPAPAGPTIDYVIDGLNRRIGKKVNGALVRRWLYDGPLRIVAELDGAGALVSRFVYATRVNVPDYMVRGGVTYRIVTDHLGSPRLVINAATGAVVQEMNHDEFGRLLQDTNPGFIPFGFAGGLHDPDTGLVRFGARDYDPAAGRWTSKDPIRFDGAGFGLYDYAFADPLNFVDATGKNPAVVAVGVGLVGLLGYEISQGAARTNDAKERVGMLNEAAHHYWERGDTQRAQRLKQRADEELLGTGARAIETGYKCPGTFVSGPAPVSKDDLIQEVGKTTATSDGGEVAKAAGGGVLFIEKHLGKYGTVDRGVTSGRRRLTTIYRSITR